MKKEIKQKTKPEVCDKCGQVIDAEIYKKHMKKHLIKMGLPSLAKLLFK